MVRSNIPSRPDSAAIQAGVTADAGEINRLDGAGTGAAIAAGKVVIADGNKDILGARNVTGTGAIQGATVIGTTSITSPAFDAGSSGAAGSVDVFPATGSKGKIAITAGDSAGNTTTTIVNASQAAARTYTIPDALASAAQFLLGMQGAVARTATVAGATTGTIADAGLFQFIVPTASDANHIIILPTPTPGTIVVLAGTANGYELRSSAPATVGINGGTSAAGESAIAADMMVIVVCESATNWKGLTIAANGTVTTLQVAAD